MTHSVTLPDFIQAHIHQLVQHVSHKVLSVAQLALENAYRGQTERVHRYMDTADQRLAYLTTRLPATYAACTAVLAHLEPFAEQIQHILDIGAGPGAASLAALSFLQPAKVTMIDQAPYFQKVATDLVQLMDAWRKTGNPAATPTEPLSCTYQVRALEGLTWDAPVDCVLSSYALNEVPSEAQGAWVRKAWDLTQDFLVLIEPGTPRGFEGIRQARAVLIEQGARILAPCTHENQCPMQGQDWCHFRVRLERSLDHRLAKGGTKPYEDEKYCYLIARRAEIMSDRMPYRIIKNPMARSGHVVFDLCGQNGVERKTISRKMGDAYDVARHKEWGDIWGEPVD